MEIVIVLVWLIMSLLIMSQIGPFCKSLPLIDQIIVTFVCMIFGPIMILNELIAAFLDCYLPEGWDGGTPI